MQIILKDYLDYKFFNLFFKPRCDKGVILLNNNKSNGHINIQTSQIKFSFSTLIGFVGAIVIGTSTVTHLFDRLVLDNDTQSKRIQELEELIRSGTSKTDSVIVQRDKLLKQIQEQLNQMKTN